MYVCPCSTYSRGPRLRHTLALNPKFHIDPLMVAVSLGSRSVSSGSPALFLLFGSHVSGECCLGLPMLSSLSYIPLILNLLQFVLIYVSPPHLLLSPLNFIYPWLINLTNNLNSHFLDLSGECSTLFQSLCSVSFCCIAFFCCSFSFCDTPFEFLLWLIPHPVYVLWAFAFFLCRLAGKISLLKALSTVHTCQLLHSHLTTDLLSLSLK